jgi:signal peptidase I
MRRVRFVAAVMLGTLAGTLLVAVFMLVAGGVRAYAIPSSAMEPTLRCSRPGEGCEGAHDDRVLVLAWGARYQRRDIVAFRAPPVAETKCGVGGTFVKRIIGLPGEKVEIRLRSGAAFVYVDGRGLEEPYVDTSRRGSGPEQSFRVPEGGYFVLGDNRARSCDSRIYGPVSEEQLVGELFLTYWPASRVSFR